MRTAALDKAREENYNYVFSVDSDVLLHPKTLEFLLQDNKDIAVMGYWYRLNRGLGCNYFYSDYWKKWPNINENFYKKGVYEIGTAGAVTLIGKRILDIPELNYFPIDCVPFTKWEDYAFCLRAYALIPDLQIVVDTRLPARHLYTEKDYIRWMMEKKAYE